MGPRKGRCYGGGVQISLRAGEGQAAALPAARHCGQGAWFSFAIASLLPSLTLNARLIKLPCSFSY